MISGTLVKILGITLLIVVAVVLVLGIGTLFKGGETSKKYSNKLMQYRVLFQFYRSYFTWLCCNSIVTGYLYFI